MRDRKVNPIQADSKNICLQKIKYTTPSTMILPILIQNKNVFNENDILLFVLFLVFGIYLRFYACN